MQDLHHQQYRETIENRTSASDLTCKEQRGQVVVTCAFDQGHVREKVLGGCFGYTASREGSEKLFE